MKQNRREYALGYTDYEAGSKRVVLYQQDKETGQLRYVSSLTQTPENYNEAEYWGEDQLRVIGMNYIEQVAPNQSYKNLFAGYRSILRTDTRQAILKVIGKGIEGKCLYSLVLSGDEGDYYYGDMVVTEQYEIKVTTLRNCQTHEELHSLKMLDVIQSIEKDYLDIMVDSLRIESLCTEGNDLLRGEKMQCQKNGTD